MKFCVNRHTPEQYDDLFSSMLCLAVCISLCITGCLPRRDCESRRRAEVKLVIVTGGKESGRGASILDLSRVNPIMAPGGMSLLISEDIKAETSVDKRRVKVIASRAIQDGNVLDEGATIHDLERSESFIWELMPTDLIRFNGRTMEAKTLVDLGNKGSTNDVNNQGGNLNNTTGVVAKRNVPFAGSTGQVSVYTVCPGDDLFSIAIRFKVGVGDLRAANNLPSMDVKVGQRLSIPVAPEFGSE